MLGFQNNDSFHSFLFTKIVLNDLLRSLCIRLIPCIVFDPRNGLIYFYIQEINKK